MMRRAVLQVIAWALTLMGTRKVYAHELPPKWAVEEFDTPTEHWMIQECIGRGMWRLRLGGPYDKRAVDAALKRYTLGAFAPGSFDKVVIETHLSVPRSGELVLDLVVGPKP